MQAWSSDTSVFLWILWKFQPHLFYRWPSVAASTSPLCLIHLKSWNCIKINLFHSSRERTTPTYLSNFLIWNRLYTLLFIFSIKLLQTSLIINELIKHENQFNWEVFHDRGNSENRFSEFCYFTECFKNYCISWTFLGSLHDETIVKYVFHEMH